MTKTAMLCKKGNVKENRKDNIVSECVEYMPHICNEYQSVRTNKQARENVNVRIRQDARRRNKQLHRGRRSSSLPFQD